MAEPLFQATHDALFASDPQAQPDDPISQLFNPPPSATDTELGAIASRAFETRFGLPSTDGALINNGVPLDGSSFHNKVRAIVEQGETSLDTPELTEWRKTDPTDREARLAIALRARPSEATFQQLGTWTSAQFQNLTPDPDELAAMPPDLQPDPAEPIPQASARASKRTAWVADQRKAKATAAWEDDLIADHSAKLAGQNFLVLWRTLSPDLSPRAQAMVTNAIKSGGKITDESDITAFQTLPVEEVRSVSLLVQASRPNPNSQWFTDTGDAVATISKKLIPAAGKVIESAASDEPGARRFLSQMAIESQVSDEIRLRRQLLDQANAHKPYDGDYGLFLESLKGAITTLPYMGAAAIPFAGIHIIAQQQFQDMRDQLIADGADPAQAAALQVASAYAYALTERLQFRAAFGRPLTTLQRRALFLSVTQRGARAILPMVGKATPEVLWSTITETVEEGIQSALSGGTFAAITDRDIIATAVHDGARDLKDSVGTMGMISLLGVPVKAHAARIARANQEALSEFLIRRQQAETALRPPVPFVQPDSAAIATTLARGRSIWSAAKTDAAAVRALEDLLGTDHDTAIALHDYYRHETAFLDMATPAARAILRDTDPLDLPTLLTTLIPGATVTPIITAPARSRADSTSPAPASATTDPGPVPAAAPAAVSSRILPPGRAARKARRAAERAASPVSAVDGAAPAPAPSYLVSIPTPSGPRSYTITMSRSGPDTTSRAFAASVEQATSGEIPAATYFESTTAQQAAIIQKYRLAHRGQSTAAASQITLPDGTTHDLAGMVSLIARPEPGQTLPQATAEALPSTALHEHAHIAIAIARDAGIISPDQTTTLRNLFGDPRPGVNETFNEEAFADAFAAWNLGKSPATDTAITRIFTAIRDFLERLFRSLGLLPAETRNQAGAIDTAFNALLTGDWSNLDAYAGITIVPGPVTAAAPAAAPATPPSAAPATFAPPSTLPGQAPAPARASKASPADSPALPTEAETDAAVSASRDASKEPARTERRPDRIAALEAKIDQLLAAQAAAPAPRAAGSPTLVSIVTPTGGIRFGAEWQAVELDSLITSDLPTYPQSYQPRDRDTVTSQTQIINISQPGVFDPSRYLDSAESDGGSPITAAQNIVLSGNGRTLALRRLAQAGRFSEYETAARQYATAHGIPLDGLRQPVLVRRITTIPEGSTLQQIAELSNRPKILQRNESELAEADAKLLTPALLGLYAPGADGYMQAVSNAPFMQAFARAAGAEGDLDSRGRPTDALALRVRSAFLAAIIGQGPDSRAIIRTLIERSGELGMRTMLNSLIDSAGHVLSLAETKPTLSIVPHLQDAVRKYVAWRTDGQAETLDAFLAQADLLSGPPAAETALLIRATAAGRLSPVLSRYTELARAVDTATPDMFGHTTSALDLLQQADTTAPASPVSAVDGVPTPAPARASKASAAPADPRPFTPTPYAPTALDTATGVPVFSLVGTAGKAVPSASAPDPDTSPSTIPLFQGGKRSLAPRAAAALKRLLTPSERDRYTTLFDGFGGSGGWGLFLANEVFPNARTISIGDFNPYRLAKIRFFHERGNTFADVLASSEWAAARQTVIDDMLARGTTSAGPLATAIHSQIKGNEKLADDIIAVAMAIADRAANGARDAADTQDQIFQRVSERAQADSENIFAAAQQYRARGGSFVYRTEPDTYKADIPTGNTTFAIIDPPYYLTTGYSPDLGKSETVGIDIYQQTGKLLSQAAAAGNGILYTDSVWWTTEEFVPMEAETLFGERHSTEQKILLDIINALDHLDIVDGKVGQRQETIGVQHGHTTANDGSGERTILPSDQPGRGRDATETDTGRTPDDPQTPLPGMAQAPAGEAGPLRSSDDSGQPSPRFSVTLVQSRPPLTTERDPDTAAAFGSWSADLAGGPDRIRGYRDIVNRPAGKPGASVGRNNFGATEGDGVYIAKTADDAEFFGSPRPLTFDMPRRALIVDQDNRGDPLPLLQAFFTDDIGPEPMFASPEAPTDSDWIRAHKRAYAQAGWKTDDDPAFSAALSEAIVSLGYDAILIRSGGQEWINILRDLDIRTSARTRYSVTSGALGFYSQLRATLSTKMPTRATAAALRGLIDPAKGSGIRADELRWSGFQDFLDLLPPDAIVTRDAALAAIRDVPLTETVLGDPANEVEGAFGGRSQRSPDTAPRYAQYTTPGSIPGTYRERLIQMPPATDNAAAAKLAAAKAAADTAFARRDLARNAIIAGIDADDRAAVAAAELAADTAFNEFRAATREAHNLEAAIYAAQASTFTTSHFPNTPNILTHIRQADRRLPDGTTAILIEEIQSDWHQKGREKGYKSEKTLWLVKLQDGRSLAYNTEAEARADADKQNQPYTLTNEAAADAVPPAPYADTSKGWARLALKRMLRVAAERGIRSILWTTGAQQTDRYNEAMRQNVDRITVLPPQGAPGQGVPGPNYVRVVATKDSSGVFKEDIPLTGTTHSHGHDVALEDVIGKELAAKVRAAPDQAHDFTGPDLAIGGHGMREFYDRILPRIATNLGKPYGEQATLTTIGVPGPNAETAAVEAIARDLAAEWDADTGLSSFPDTIDQEALARVFGAMSPDGDAAPDGYATTSTFAEALARERRYGDEDQANAIETHVRSLANPIQVWRLDIPPAMATDILAGQPRHSVTAGAPANIEESFKNAYRLLLNAEDHAIGTEVKIDPAAFGLDAETAARLEMEVESEGPDPDMEPDVNEADDSEYNGRETPSIQELLIHGYQALINWDAGRSSSKFDTRQAILDNIKENIAQYGGGNQPMIGAGGWNSISNAKAEAIAKDEWQARWSLYARRRATANRGTFSPRSPAPRHHVTRGPARDPAAILEALVAARILAGKTPTTEEVSAILRNVGSPDADPAAILTAATTRAKTSAATALASAKLSEREIFESLATDAQRDRLTSRLDATFHQGAAYAEPGIDAAVAADRLADKTAKLAILSAAGYTAAEMQSELGVDLAAATLAMPPRVLTPEEQAELDAARKKRQAEQDAAEAEAEALTLAEGQAATTAAPPSPQMQALVADLLARARTRVEAQRLEDQRKRLDKAGQVSDAAPASDPAAAAAADAAEQAALDLSEAEVTRLVAPALADPDEFAAFIFEWSRQRIAKDRPHLKPDSLFRDPAALRDLARTAQHILRGLATDLLPFGQTREVALRNIDDLEHARTDRRILRQIAFIYSRIQATAQKHTRETLIADLETTITRLAKEPGRFIPQREDLRRRVTAAVETFARNLLSYIHLTPTEIEAETRRLQDIIAKADAEETSTGYAKTQDREFRRAIDQLAVLAQYGGMASWMPGKISDASEIIIEQLSGARAEHEARIAEHEAAAARMSGTLSGAIMRSDADLRPDPNALARFADSLIGNVRIRLMHLIRFAPAGKIRTDAETTIEDITVILGDGAIRYRTTQAEAHAAINAALTEIYGNALDAVRHLDTPIPADISRQLSHQGEPLTYGQAIQLYGSIIQRDYRDNVRRHARHEALPILRAVLSETDMRLHLWMVQYYATRRETLSQAQQEITGLPILSPDQFYIPVRMRIDPTGFRGRHASWSPILKSLTPRIRNRRDFDERTSILDVFADSLQDAALITAYGARGIFLRELFGSEAVQGTIERWHGKAARAGLIDQIEDTLRGGRQITKSDSFLTAANKLRRWTARFYLSGNVASALKQTASIPVWANVIGFRDLGRYLVDIDPEAVRSLMQSPGFAARYSAGWSEETANILSETHRTAIARAYDKGLLLNSAMDAVSAIWIGQGLYRDLRARFLDEGRPEPEATSRAQTIVWSLIEETQQSARTENLPRFMREGGGMTRFVTQFILSPLQQLAFEVEAIREAHAGTPGSKAKLARALIINHILVPAIFQAIQAGWSALLGFPPDDDDKKKRQKWAEIITASLIGQFGAIFLVGNMAEQGILTLLGGKPQYGSSGAIPAESIGRVLTNSIKTLTHAGQIGINLLTPTDLFDVTTDDLLADLDRLAGNISAPYRHISQAVKNYRDE